MAGSLSPLPSFPATPVQAPPPPAAMAPAPAPRHSHAGNACTGRKRTVHDPPTPARLWRLPVSDVRFPQLSHQGWGSTPTRSQLRKLEASPTQPESGLGAHPPSLSHCTSGRAIPAHPFPATQGNDLSNSTALAHIKFSHFYWITI